MIDILIHFQNLFEQKPANPPANRDNKSQNRNSFSDFNKSNNSNNNRNKNEQKNKQSKAPRLFTKRPAFFRSFFQVTYQENYDPLRKHQRPPPTIPNNPNNINNPQNPIPENLFGPPSDIFFQRNPPSKNKKDLI